MSKTNEGEMRSLQLLQNHVMRIILKKIKKNTYQMNAGLYWISTQSNIEYTYIDSQN
jgi:hypothetical protein